MTSEQFVQFKKEMKDHIESVIQTKVNGKIDNMNRKLDSYIEKDEEWKGTAKPAIKLGTNMLGFGIVGGYIIGVLAAIGACWGVVQWVATLLIRK